MVKPTLSGKRPQTTTQALGSNIARWILSAGCGVMVLVDGELVAADITVQSGQLCCTFKELVRGEWCDHSIHILCCRIYRSTVAQIKAMAG